MNALMQRRTTDTTSAGNNRQPRPAPAFKPEFLRSARMHPMVALAAGLATFALVMLFAMRIKTLYQAESLVYVAPVENKLLDDGQAHGFDSTAYDSYLQQQIQTAQRADILAAAIASLPRQDWLWLGANAQAAAASLGGQLKVSRVGITYQVAIDLKGPDAAKTAAVVNAVTDAYLHAGHQDEVAQSGERAQLLDEERNRIAQELATDRSEQAALGASIGVANPAGDGANHYDAQLSEIRSQLTTAREQHEIAAAQLSAVAGGAPSQQSGMMAAANDLIANDSGLGGLKQTINQRRAVLSSQMAGLTPGNPVYKQDQDELADLDRTLETATAQARDKAARTLADKLRTDLARTGDVASRINAQLAAQTAAATGAAPKLQRASEIAQDIQRLTTRYGTVDNTIRGLQLETNGPGMTHLSLAAAVPAAPEPNRRPVAELAALPLALMVGFFAAVFVRQRDHRIYSPADIDAALGFAPIAVLPARAEVATEVMDECFLRLAAGIEDAFRSGGARTVLLTPVSARTRIESLTAALDRKLRELGLTVAVVAAAAIFEQRVEAEGRGFGSVLFDSLKSEHDLVLVESAPLLASAQTEYAARCADVTILIAECAVTRREELSAAGKLLERLKVSGVGAVLDELQLRYADGAFRKTIELYESGAVRAVHFAASPVAATQEPYLQAEPAPAAAEQILAGQEISPLPPSEVDAQNEINLHSEDFSAEPAPVEEAPSTLFDHRNEVLEEALQEPVETRQTGLHVVSRQHQVQQQTYAEGVTPMPSKSWLERIFHRDEETTYKILPDAEDEPAQAYTAPEPAPRASRTSLYDLPLRDEQAPAQPEPVAVVVAPVAASEPVYAAVEAPVPVAAVGAPAAPEPVAANRPPARPMTFAELMQMSQAVAQAPVAEAPALMTPAPFAAEIVQPQPVAEVVTAPVPEPGSLPEPVRFEPVVEAVDEPVAQAEPELMMEAEPVPEVPEPVAATPEPVAAIPEPVAAQPDPIAAPLPHVAEIRPMPASIRDERSSKPSRWDPIPPLRSVEEPWRSGVYAAAQRQAAQPRPQETSRYTEQAVPPDEPGEQALTRRWGLLSRFQQAESFSSIRRAAVVQEPLDDDRPEDDDLEDRRAYGTRRG